MRAKRGQKGDTSDIAQSPKSVISDPDLITGDEDAVALAVKILSRWQIVHRSGGRMILFWRGMKLTIEKDLAWQVAEEGRSLFPIDKRP